LRLVTPAAKGFAQAPHNAGQDEIAAGFTGELRRTKPHSPIRMNNVPSVGLPHSLPFISAGMNPVHWTFHLLTARAFANDFRVVSIRSSW
jgi:hypothetical protein